MSCALGSRSFSACTRRVIVFSKVTTLVSPPIWNHSPPRAPPFLYLRKVPPALTMPSVLRVTVAALRLASLPPPSLAPQVSFPGLASAASPGTLQRLPDRWDGNADFGQRLHSASPASPTQPFLFAPVPHCHPAHTFSFSPFVAAPPTSELQASCSEYEILSLLLFFLDWHSQRIFLNPFSHSVFITQNGNCVCVLWAAHY